MKIEKLPIKDWSVIEAIAAIIPALNQVIDHLNQAETTPEEWKIKEERYIENFENGVARRGLSDTLSTDQAIEIGLEAMTCHAPQKEQASDEKSYYTSRCTSVCEGGIRENGYCPAHDSAKPQEEPKKTCCRPESYPGAMDGAGHSGPCEEKESEPKEEQASKNEKLLKEFTEYCRKYPDQRFWQALRNWSGAQNIIWEDEVTRQDTFYWEGKHRDI